jgi:hypothetical protein
MTLYDDSDDIGAYWQEKRKFTASEVATTKTLNLIIGKALSYLV